MFCRYNLQQTGNWNPIALALDQTNKLNQPKAEKKKKDVSTQEEKQKISFFFIYSIITLTTNVNQKSNSYQQIYVTDI